MNNAFRKATLGSFLAILALGMAAPAFAHDFEPGYYYATGWIEPKGTSIQMEGTHKLVTASGTTITFLSSDYYTLSSYECLKVRVLGWVEHSVEGHGYHMDVIDTQVLEPGRITLSLTTVERGNDSKYEDTRSEIQRFAIRDQATWKLFFQLHKPGGELPYVDFNRYQVLGAYMGPKNTTVHAIAIVKVEKAGSTTYVTTKSYAPPADSRLPYLKNPVHPFAIVRAQKNTGPVYFDGQHVKVLTKTDLVGDPNAFVAVGNMALPENVDRSKLKVALFGMNINARYFVWPGTFPTDIARLSYSELSQLNHVFAKALKPGDSVPDPNHRYYVIVWEDLNDDNSTSGDRLSVSSGLIWTGTSWTAEQNGQIYPSAIGYFAFDLNQ